MANCNVINKQSVFKKIFSGVSLVIRDSICFAPLRSVIGPDSRHFSTNEKQKCNQTRLSRPRLPALQAVCVVLNLSFQWLFKGILAL